MCDFSMGFYQDGLNKGVKQGRAEGISIGKLEEQSIPSKSCCFINLTQVRSLHFLKFLLMRWRRSNAALLRTDIDRIILSKMPFAQMRRAFLCGFPTILENL